MEDIENKFISNNNVQIVQETNRQDDDEEKKAPDGGTRAWLVMIGSFFCNGIIFGVINSYGVLYTEIQEQLQTAGISEASSKAGWYLDENEVIFLLR